MTPVETAAPYQPAELEVVARLLLQDQAVRVVTGAWWSYHPDRAEVIYPPNLLAEWPASRSLGALCHEIAEVIFSGREASQFVPDFIERAVAQGCEPGAAALLLNAINDLRVNQRYLERYPGSRRYLRSVYEPARPLDPMTDQPSARSRNPLAHHALLSALTARWAGSRADPRQNRTTALPVWPTPCGRRSLARLTPLPSTH